MNISTKYHIPARELDFANINLSGDNQLFIDPLKLKKENKPLHQKAYQEVNYFMQKLLTLARERKIEEINQIIENLYERNETKLGYSIRTKHGKSFGENGGKILFHTLAKSEVILTGLVEDIFDCIIMLPNIGEDKVSDLITTIIFLDLVKYTQQQCQKYHIPMREVELEKLCWNPQKEQWEKVITKLPIHCKKPIVFIPKSMVSRKVEFSYEKLYRQLIIPFYKQRELEDSKSKLVLHYKNGRVQVKGNELRKLYPCTKYVILDFVKKYDSLYREYKKRKIDYNSL